MASETDTPGALAPMKAQVYKDPRPAEYFDRFYERAQRRDPDAVYEMVRLVVVPYLSIAFRSRSISSEKVPPGGVILAPNHFSFMDHFFAGAFVRRRVQFMAKSQLFAPPMQWIYTHGGVFPVRRGARDDRAFETARAVLDRGNAIVMYCEGGRSRTGQLAERAKPGLGRLALETGAPIVPIAIHGSHRVRNWKRLRFPKVTVQYGDPLRFEALQSPTREQAQRAADEVFSRIKTLYAGLEAHGSKVVRRRARAERRARSGRGAAPAST